MLVETAGEIGLRVETLTSTDPLMHSDKCGRIGSSQVLERATLRQPQQLYRDSDADDAAASRMRLTSRWIR